MKIKLRRVLNKEEVTNDVFYVSQDNYELIDLKLQKDVWKYLYCDSATSCIIIIVTGNNTLGNPAIAISHLSRPDRFNTFWKIINDNFRSEICVFAHGANPPQPGTDKSGEADYTALRNLNIVNQWILKHSIYNTNQNPNSNFLIQQATLIFGEGNPSEYRNDLDCYGVDISTGIPVISNRRFNLSIKDRDPSGGLQSLFCSFGLKLDPPMILIQASKAFSSIDQSSLISNKDRLLKIAHENNYERYENMTDKEILRECSSTPDAEVPWFCQTIREAAKYVRINYKP